MRAGRCIGAIRRGDASLSVKKVIARTSGRRLGHDANRKHAKPGTDKFCTLDEMVAECNGAYDLDVVAE